MPLPGKARYLPYPLDRAVVLQNEVPAETIPGQPAWADDSEERIFVVMNVSLNEYVIIASAIDAGRDPAYPDQSQYVWWLWNRIIMPLTFCQYVIDCIENDTDTQAALDSWFASAVNNSSSVQNALANAFNPAQGGSAIPNEYALQNQYGAALGCDEDDGWGHIRSGLVDRSFQRVQDVLERIEFVTDNQEMLAEFINAIPGVGAFFDVIPVTDWVLWFDNVRAFMKDGFEAGDSTELRDTIACDLFCIWQVDCSLSVEQIRQYYWSKTAALAIEWENAFDSMSELAATLAAATDILTPETIVYALVGSQYGFLTFVNDWFGIHINATAGDLAVGEPSDDWIALCDDCPMEAYNVGILGSCGEGIKSTVYFEAGVPFNVVAYEDTIFADSWIIALHLPSGSWNVALNSITGTIVPPADLNETAYAWIDTSSVWHNVQWNAPATPADLPPTDTTAGVFNAWCSTQSWNVVLLNRGAFTASFTVTAV